LDLKTTDLLKYVTVYHGAFDAPRDLLEAVQTAPHGDGYILTKAAPWEDQKGLRRTSLHEIYEDQSTLGLDYEVMGGDIFKSLVSRYPKDKIKLDDTAYEPVTKILDVFQAVQDDYLARWDLNIDALQYSQAEFRYYDGPQGVGPHSDYEGYLELHPNPQQAIRLVGEHGVWNMSFAMNAYLNDDYGKGGELFVRRYKEESDGTYTTLGAQEGGHRPLAGDFICFPSAFPYEHWMTPIGPNVKRHMINLNVIQTTPPTWQFS
jgi:hypothetical protein